MRFLIVLLMAVATTSAALDICPQYSAIHNKDVMPKIQSGVPFKLLSVAADSRGTYRKIVRVEYDLWSEKVAVEVNGEIKHVGDLKESLTLICRALSMPDVRVVERMKYQVMLNPDLSDGLERLHAKGVTRSGFLEINWKRLANDLQSEKLLIESEMTP